MKAYIITASSYLDSCLPLVNQLSKKIDIHLIVNYTEDTKRASIVDIKTKWNENTIIYNASELLGPAKDLIDDTKKISVTFVYWKSLKILRIKNIIFLRKLFSLIENNAIVHLQFIYFFYWYILKAKKNIKLIADFHDPIEHSNIKRKIMLEYTKKKICKMSSKILIHNQSNIEEFKQKYKIKTPIIVIPLGCENKTKRYMENENVDPTIIFFGRIAPYKGLEYLINAVELLIKKHKQLKVIIAGEGKMYFNSEDILKSPIYEVYNNYIPMELLEELIIRSSVVVCPYIDATQSGVIMMAYSYNKPVIASNVGGLREVIIDGKTGYLVEAKNPESLYIALDKYFSDSNIRNVMKKNIPVYIEKMGMSWNKIAEKTLWEYVN